MKQLLKLILAALACSNPLVVARLLAHLPVAQHAAPLPVAELAAALPPLPALPVAQLAAAFSPFPVLPVGQLVERPLEAQLAKPPPAALSKVPLHPALKVQAQASSAFSQASATALRTLSDELKQFQSTIEQRSKQLTMTLQEDDKANLAIEAENVHLEDAISQFKKSNTMLEKEVTRFGEENKKLRAQLRAAAKAAAEAASEGNDLEEARAIVVAEGQPPKLTQAPPQPTQAPLSSGFDPSATTLVKMPATPQSSQGELVEQPHDSDQNGESEAGGDSAQEESSRQQAPMAVPSMIRTATQVVVQHAAVEGRQEEDEGYAEAFGSDGLVEPDGGAASFLSVSMHRSIPYRSKAQNNSAVEQTVALLTKGSVSFAGLEEQTTSQLESAFWKEFRSLKQRHSELLTKQNNLKATRSSLEALNERLVAIKMRLSTSRARLQQKVNSLEGIMQGLQVGV